MANTTGKNPAPNKGTQAKANEEELPDFSKWTPLQIGFAPYWHPEPGKRFFGEIVQRDDRDPEFVRYLVKTHKTEECRRGPNNDDTAKGAVGEKVIVNKGDTFSISVYYSLADEFDFHLFFAEKTGRHVPILVEALKTVKTKGGQDVWQWRVLVSPEDKQALDGRRDEYRRFKTGEGDGGRPELEA